VVVMGTHRVSPKKTRDFNRGGNCALFQKSSRRDSRAPILSKQYGTVPASAMATNQKIPQAQR